MPSWPIDDLNTEKLTQGIQKPEVLIISVMVLSGTKSMGNIFNTVHNRAGKIIGRIYSEEEILSFLHTIAGKEFVARTQ